MGKSLSGETQVFKTVCMACFQVCGINAYVKDGKLIKVEGMKEHPCTRGVICVRGEKLPSYVYSPDRLKYPMRKNKDGSWERISWDEALDTIASKLQKIKDEYGGKVSAISLGQSRETDVLRECLYRGVDEVVTIEGDGAGGGDIDGTLVEDPIGFELEVEGGAGSIGEQAGVDQSEVGVGAEGGGTYQDEIAAEAFNGAVVLEHAAGVEDAVALDDSGGVVEEGLIGGT